MYEQCLAHELVKEGLIAQRQLEVPIVYDGIRFDAGFRLDILVENAVIVELKAVGRLHPIHEALLLTYLRLSRQRVGLILNFNVVALRDGIVRRVL